MSRKYLKFSVMVAIALRALDEGNGSTIPSLTKYIADHFTVADNLHKSIKSNTRKAIKRGQSKGLIEQLDDPNATIRSYKLIHTKEKRSQIDVRKVQSNEQSNEQEEPRRKYLDRIISAIKALNESNGSLYYTICGYIVSNFKDLGMESVANDVKQALKRGVDTGRVIEEKGQSGEGLFKIGIDSTAKVSKRLPKRKSRNKKQKNNQKSEPKSNQKLKHKTEGTVELLLKFADLMTEPMNGTEIEPKIAVKTEPVIDTNSESEIKVKVEPIIKQIIGPELKIKSEPIF